MTNGGCLSPKAMVIYERLVGRQAEVARTIAELEGARAVRLENGRGQRAIIHRRTDPNQLLWRVTWLTAEGEPSGHGERETFATALSEALMDGYRVTEVRR